MNGVVTTSLARDFEGIFGDENLMIFTYANGLAPECVEKENDKLLLGIALESNKRVLIEKCKPDVTGENDYEK